METIGINCSCGNEHAFILSQRLAECTQCQTVHSIDDVKSYTSYDITPLHVLEQRAKDQALKDMLDEWHLECHENNIKAELDSMYRRDLATQYGCALEEKIITQKEHDDMIHSLNLEYNRFWATCFDTEHEQFGVPF